MRPAYLELRETGPGLYDVLWKMPALGENLRLSLGVQFPGETLNVTGPRSLFRNGAYIERWQIQNPCRLGGKRIAIEGLSATRIDTLVRVTDISGVTQTARATPDAPSITIATAVSDWSVAGTFLALGVEHIFLGIDHLLFVLALVLLVKGWKNLSAPSPLSPSPTASHLRVPRSGLSTSPGRPSRHASH